MSAGRVWRIPSLGFVVSSEGDLFWWPTSHEARYESDPDVGTGLIVIAKEAYPGLWWWWLSRVV